MPGQIDIALGRRLAELRQVKGLTTDDLAAALSVTAARITGFEAGSLRLTVTDLVGLSGALGVPIASLFSGLRPGNIVTFPGEPTTAEGHLLMTAFLKIRDAQARLSLLQMAEYLAS